ncbi:MAG: adenosylhomocysteinase [Clostridiales bacterium]|nr:adenosylhomocysteinase [Clostridiales bacterium]
MSIIKDKSLYNEGLKKIEWVRSYMPVMRALEERFKKERPFEGVKIAMSIHLEAKTAYLATVLKAGGATVFATGCNPLSTRDDIAAALDHLGLDVFAIHGVNEEEYTYHLKKALEGRPNIIIDDGGDLVKLLHGECEQYGEEVWGGCEETTTGIHRLKARAKAGDLKFPMLAVNDANCKYLFDNRYGTGQSVWDGIFNATNVVVAGKTLVVAGYGWCGKGVAMRGKGMGANVIVTEINPYRALEAAMDGFRVMKMDDAAPIGDIFVTVTGCKDVIVKRHFEAMKDGAIMANAGHFDVEINKVDLKELSEKVVNRKDFIDGYYMKDGRVLNLMSEGRLVNITAGNGHPADIMDMSFGLQSLSALYMVKNAKSMKPDLYDVPDQIDREVAMLKIGAMGLGLDILTEDQQAYIDAE